MIKGNSRRVIVVDAPDPRIFEKAIFILKPSPKNAGVTESDILKEAQRAADSYLRRNVGRRIKKRPHLPAPLYAAAGAAATAVAWIASLVLK